MSIEANTGGPAFPTGIGLNANKTWIGSGSDGMTLRDYFAAKAMQGILTAVLTPNTVLSQDMVVETAYNVADAMLKARES